MLLTFWVKSMGGGFKEHNTEKRLGGIYNNYNLSEIFSFSSGPLIPQSF